MHIIEKMEIDKTSANARIPALHKDNIEESETNTVRSVFQTRQLKKNTSCLKQQKNTEKKGAGGANRFASRMLALQQSCFFRQASK